MINKDQNSSSENEKLHKKQIFPKFFPRMLRIHIFNPKLNMNYTKKILFVIIFLCLLSLCSLGLSIYLFWQSPRIAYVHNSRILTEYLGVKESRQSYQQKVNAWQADLDSLTEALNRDFKEYRENHSKLSFRERELTEQFLKKREEDLINYKNALEVRISQEEQAMAASVLNQINNFLLEYCKTSGYDYIFGVTADGSIHYARKGDDITDEVIEALNKKYQGK